jgi:hypothetical protein
MDVYWCGILKIKTFGNLADIQNMHDPQFLFFSHFKDVESHYYKMNPSSLWVSLDFK